MAHRLGISRAAVAKVITSLRAQGLEIEAAPRRGYRLVSEPPLLLPAMVEARLKPGSLGLPPFPFPGDRLHQPGGPPPGRSRGASRNLPGGRAPKRGPGPTGSPVAGSQRQRPALLHHPAPGAGPQAGLRPEQPHLPGRVPGPEKARRGGSGHQVAQRRVSGGQKSWPGCSPSSPAGPRRWSTPWWGVGLNVNQEPQWLAGLDQPAMSLMAATGHAWDRATLLAQILEEMTALHDHFMAGGGEQMAQEYAQRSLILGLEVTVREGQAVRRGKAVGLCPGRSPASGRRRRDQSHPPWRCEPVVLGGSSLESVCLAPA